jgi:uroporphyrinogen-III synthase
MKILITRPIAKAQELAAQITSLGHTPIIAPLIEITDVRSIYTNIACIITSQHALTQLENKQTKLFILGKQTTKLAKSMGFSNATCIGKNIKELKKNISLSEQLLYVCGTNVTETLNEFSNIKREIVYKANSIQTPSPSLVEFLELNELKAALFFSNRTAETFISLVNKHRLNIKFDDIIAFSLSSKISDYLKTYGFNKCYTASEPTLSSLLTLIGKLK